MSELAELTTGTNHSASRGYSPLLVPQPISIGRTDCGITRSRQAVAIFPAQDSTPATMDGTGRAMGQLEPAVYTVATYII
jgi:hypothetical protein